MEGETETSKSMEMNQGKRRGRGSQWKLGVSSFGHGGKSLLQRDCIGEGTNLELTHDSEGSSLLRS